MRRFFGAPLTVFDSVIARDKWALQNPESTHPLGENFAERLRALEVVLNDHKLRPELDQFLDCVPTLASLLEAQSRWSEAEAYWLAASDGSQAGLREETAWGFVRAALLDAGFVGGAASADVKHLIEAALRSNETRVRNAVARAVVMLSIKDEHFYEDLMLSSQATEALAKVVSDTFTSIQGQQAKRGLTAGQLVRQCAQELSRINNDLRDQVRQITTAPSIRRLQERRQALLRGLDKLEYVVGDGDRMITQSTRRLLGDRLTAYLQYEPRRDETFHDLIAEAESGLDLVSQRGSHVGSCLLVPLMIAVGSAVVNDYEAEIRSSVAGLKVDLVKRDIAALQETTTVEVEIRNEGGGEAKDCYLRLEPCKPEDMKFEGEGFLIGRIPAGETAIAPFKASWSAPDSVIEIAWHLEYTDRSGESRDDGIQRIRRQRHLDWEQAERIPRYELASIREPGKLKGRKDKLAELRRGFQSRTSYTITGQKRVGKTSLTLVFLQELKQDGEVLGVYATVGDLDIIAATKDEILDSFAESLSGLIADEYEGTRPKLPPSSDVGAGRGLTGLKRSLDRLRRSEPNLQMVIALDDFDAVPATLLEGDTGRALFEWIRSRINSDRIVFLFVGSERLPALIYGKHGQTLNVVQKVELDYLDPDAFESLVRDPTALILEWQAEAVREVETWFARNPFYAILICQRVWNQALSGRDYYVAKRDVRRAVDELARTAEQNYFQHFWADSPRPQDEKRELEETKSAMAVLALSRLQRHSLAYVPREEVIAECQREGLKDSSGPQIVELLARGVFEADRENSELIRFRVPLFWYWLKERGSAQIRESQANRSAANADGTNGHTLSREEIEEATAGLTCRSQPVSKDDVRGWLEQFGSIERQHLMRRLLMGVREHSFGDADFQASCLELHKMTLRAAAEQGITQQLGGRSNRTLLNWYTTYCSGGTKSGSSAARTYRMSNPALGSNIGPKSLSGRPDEILRFLAQEAGKAVVVCVEDFVGTGRSAVKDLRGGLLRPLNETIPGWRDKILLIYAVVVGFDKGIDHIRDQLGNDILVLCDRVLGDEARAFSAKNSLFESDEQRLQAQRLAESIGGELVGDERSLGYGGMQALVVLRDNTPNDTLPILWSHGRVGGKQWKALFPRQ